jgi:hypothetical protein
MTERRPSLREFLREVVVAMRAAGLEGEVEQDEQAGVVRHAERGTFDVRHAYDQLVGAPAAKRTEMLSRALHYWVHPPRLPVTWDEASKIIVVQAQTRMWTVAEDLRREAAGDATRVVRGELTAHLVFEPVIWLDGVTLAVPLTHLEAWGVEPPEAFAVATGNLARRSAAQWLAATEAPGVYGSPWEDGLDAGRVTLPKVFERVPLRGRAVVLAPTPSRLLLAGSDDPEGLVQLAGLARRALEKTGAFHFLRTLRMTEQGDSWEDWLPPSDHPAHDALRLLRGVEEVRDYENQAALVRRHAAGAQATPMPPLRVLQSNWGGSPLTVTVWRDGTPVALPVADAVIFRRGEETLGIAPWDRVRRALGGSLRQMPGYPIRWSAAGFPADWQLALLRLEPWTDPLP